MLEQLCSAYFTILHMHRAAAKTISFIVSLCLCMCVYEYVCVRVCVSVGLNVAVGPATKCQVVE